jgi:hypothetical protein
MEIMMNMNDKYLEQNIEKLVRKYGGQRKMDESKKKQIIEKLKEQAGTGKIKTQSLLYRFSKYVVSTAAAVLILGILLLCIWPISKQEIKIPPELATLSAEQLLKLSNDSSKTTFDVNIVKVALQQALKKLPPEKVILIAKDFAKSKSGNSGGMLGGRGMAAPVHPVSDFSGSPRKTFPEVVEESNLFVHARLANIEINVDDIITALIDKEQYSRLEDYMSKYRVTVQLDVLDTLPKNALKKGSMFKVPAVIYDNQLNAIKENTEYFFAMFKNSGKEPKFLEYFSGIYPADYNKPATVELWQFFCDAQDILLSGKKPTQETIDYWVSRLNGETFSLALEYMDVLPDESLPAGAIMDAMENKYKDLIAQVQQNYNEAVAKGQANIPIYEDGQASRLSSNNAPLFDKSMNLLLRAGDKSSINRMLTLFNGDIELGNKSIFWRRIDNRNFRPLIVRLIIASQEGNIGNRLMETYLKYKSTPLVNQFGGSNPSYMSQYQGSMLLNDMLDQAAANAIDDIQPIALMLLEKPSDFGQDTSMIKKIWNILAKSTSYNIRPHLEKFLTSADLSDIGVNPSPNSLSVFDFEMAAFDSLASLPEANRPSHKELLSWLLTIYTRNKDNSNCRYSINDRLRNILRPQDTEFLPVLVDCLGMDYRPNTANYTGSIIAEIMPDPNLIPFINAAIAKIPNNSDIVSLLEALYACGAKDEAVTKALEVLALPLRQERYYDLFTDMYRNAELLLFLGKTQRTELIPLIEGYTQQSYIDHYFEVYKQFNDPSSRMRYYSLIDFQQRAIMALTRLGGRSTIPRLRQLYQSSDIRIKVVSALALYYNGDKTGEQLVRRFVDGTYRDIPEIDMRWGIDLSDGKLFQDIISSYLRNNLTDALWMEKLTRYLDRADSSNFSSGFFKEHKKDILLILVSQLDNRNRTIRGFANEMLQKITGRDVGFLPDRYHGQQEEKIQNWLTYVAESTKADNPKSR